MRKQTIFEYPTSPESIFEGEGNTFKQSFKWQSKCSLNLLHVTSVAPYAYDGISISVIGHSNPFPIKASYDDFVKTWTWANYEDGA